MLLPRQPFDLWPSNCLVAFQRVNRDRRRPVCEPNGLSLCLRIWLMTSLLMCCRLFPYSFLFFVNFCYKTSVRTTLGLNKTIEIINKKNKKPFNPVYIWHSLYLVFVFSSSRLLCGREHLSGSVGCSGLQSVSQSQQQIKYLAIVKGEFMCGRDNECNRTSFWGGGVLLKAFHFSSKWLVYF